MTAPRIVIPNFATIEDSLRRSLGLVGEVGTEFEPRIAPVVLVNDATRPGTQTFRGRRFAFADDIALGVVGASSVAIKALAPCILKSIWVSDVGTTGVVIQWRYVSPDVADPYAITASVPFTERVQVAGDAAPVATVNFLQADSLLGTVFNSTLTAAAGHFADIHDAIHLEANAKVIVRFANLITNVIWGFAGEVF